MTIGNAVTRAVGYLLNKLGCILFFCLLFLCAGIALALSLAVIMAVAAAILFIAGIVLLGVIIMVVCLLFPLGIYAVNQNGPAWIEKLTEWGERLYAALKERLVRWRKALMSRFRKKAYV